MGRKIIVIALILGSVFGMQAQKLNYPASKGLRQLNNGWHKFSVEGAVFDVEVSEGRLVKGNVVWFDNSKYSGSFNNNKISGKGTYTWPNGDRYEGSFKNNQRHGKGTMYWSDGTKHSGKWKNNSRNGKGKSFDPNGNLVNEGVWEGDTLVENKK